MPLCIMSPLPLGPLFLQWCYGIWLKTIVTSVDYHEEGAPNICTAIVNENAHNFWKFDQHLQYVLMMTIWSSQLCIFRYIYFFLYIAFALFVAFLVYICKYDNQLHTSFLGGVFFAMFLLHFLISSPVVILGMNIYHLTNTNSRQMKFSAVKQ